MLKNIAFVPIFVFLTGLFSANNLLSQSGWYWQNPLPQGNKLNDCQLLDSNIAFAVGDCGTILCSVNSGNSWERMVSGTTASLLRVQFTDYNVGYVIGESNTVLKSTDLGASWERLTVPGEYSNKLKGIHFINNNTGVVVGWPNVVLKTTDGGETWSSLTLGLGGGYWSDVYCIDQSNITLVSDNRNSNNGNIFSTHNGGLSWTQCQQSAYSSYLNDIVYTSVDVGYIAGVSGTILKTTNGGSYWIRSSQAWGDWYKLRFLNSQTGYVIGSSGAILRTIDGGTTWNSQNSNTALPLCGISTWNGKTGIIVGDFGIMLKSSPLGNVWTTNYISVSSSSLNRLSILNDSSFIVGGTNGVLLETTNLGLSWLSQNSGTQENIYGIDFINSQTGWFAAGRSYYPVMTTHGSVYRTTNAGLNWISQFSTDLYVISDVSFNDLNTGFFCSSSGSIYRSVNSGSNWSNVYLGTNSLVSLFFLSSYTGYAVGGGGLIVKTTSSGDNWLNVSLTVNVNLRSVCFTDNNTGFVVGSQGKIFSTSNGGLNWVLRNLMTTNDLNRVFFLNANTGYIASKEMVQFTTNGGLNWMEQPVFTKNDLKDLVFTGVNNGFVVGENGCILSTINVHNPIGILTNTNSIPKSYSLSQNYPNPFNPSTKIKFDIPLSRGVPEGRGVSVQLIIYDILGREVATLINEQLKPGTYEADWDGSNYASGIYFYSLQTSNFTVTKKMLMIK